MKKFQRPVQSHGEYAGLYVPPLPDIRIIANRMLDEDIGITGFNRLERHLENVGDYLLYDAKDIEDAFTIAGKIHMWFQFEYYADISLDDVCHLWYMDQCARFVSTHPTAREDQIYEFYQGRLLREMKTFMVTYKQGLMRKFLTQYTVHADAKIAERSITERLSAKDYHELLDAKPNQRLG